MNTITTDRDDNLIELQEVIFDEVKRQESRVDVKGNQLLAITSILIPLSAFGITAVARYNPWALIPLAGAILLWIISLVICLIRVIYPRLSSNGTLGTYAVASADQFRIIKCGELKNITTYRFRAVRIAVIIIICGFGLFVTSGCVILAGVL